MVCATKIFDVFEQSAICPWRVHLGVQACGHFALIGEGSAPSDVRADAEVSRT
jgi:hypothetical protein